MHMLMLTQAIRLPACSVCHDNLATDEQVVLSKWTGIGKFGICCRCKRLVRSVDRNYQCRWRRWYKKHCQ
jgi:hypothetical protein